MRCYSYFICQHCALNEVSAEQLRAGYSWFGFDYDIYQLELSFHDSIMPSTILGWGEFLFYKVGVKSIEENEQGGENIGSLNI